MKDSFHKMSTFKSNDRLNNIDLVSSRHEKVRSEIKRELKKQKYTYESFAKLFNKTEGWFSHIMTGRTKLTIDLIYEIAEKLNVDPLSLLPPTDNPKAKLDFEDYIWNSIKERLDRYFDEKLKKIK